jgi:hypothetical protein
MKHNHKIGDLVLSELRGLGMITSISGYAVLDITWYDNHKPVDYLHSVVDKYRDNYLNYRDALNATTNR